MNEEISIGHLFANLCRIQSTRASQLLEHIGLHRGQSILLVILSTEDGLTHSEIAEKLTISPAAATKVIKRLEELGYLQRRSDVADERISRVFLKDEGRAVLEQIHAAFQRIDRMMARGFTPEEQSQLRSLLERLQANLEEQLPASTLSIEKL